MIADERRWRAVLLLVLLPVVVVVEEIEGELEASQTHRLHYNLRSECACGTPRLAVWSSPVRVSSPTGRGRRVP